MNRKITLLILTAVFMTGCTLIPKYSRPEAPVPADWPDGPAYGDTASIQESPVAYDMQWREFFPDERLREVIDTALGNNRDLRAAALNVERARALYRIQRSEILPIVNAVGSGAKDRLPAFSRAGRDATQEQYSVSLGISSWEIDFFGRIRSLEQQALEHYFATEEARRSTQLLLIAEVANTWLTLAADRDNLRLARSTREAQQAAYDLIKRRYDVGLAPELELHQAQTRVEVTRLDVARFTEQVARDQNALNLLAGTPVAAELLPDALSAVTPPQDVSAGTSSEVLLRRPDVLQAEHLLIAANANIGAARAAFFPRIALFTAFGTASDDLSGLFSSGTDFWNYGARIAVPIFDPRIRPAFNVSKVDREFAVARYEKTIQEAFREVADALAQRGTIADQMAAQQSLVDATAASYRLSNMRYKKGIDTYLTVLDAQRSLYAAQQGLITVRLTKLANQVRLYAVLGGGAANEKK